jgi:predicted HicB family RNase H-like nuclease
MKIESEAKPYIQIRTPPQLSKAIRTAASRDLLSVSAYIRQALVQKLRADGINPAVPIVPPASE